VSRVCRVQGLSCPVFVCPGFVCPGFVCPGFVCPGFVVSRVYRVQCLSVQGLSGQGLSVQGLSVQGLSVQGLRYVDFLGSSPRFTYRGLPCSAAFQPRFAMLRSTHLSAEFSKKVKSSPCSNFTFESLPHFAAPYLFDAQLYKCNAYTRRIV
jgi:hypothetical protein